MTEGSLKERQAQRVREDLLASATELVEGGREPTMRAVAKGAGVAERTIYRYFSSRDELFHAMLPILQRRASAPLPTTAGQLPAYAAALFATFEENPTLVRSLVNASWLAPKFKHARAQRVVAIQTLLRDAFPMAAEAELRSAATLLRVQLSGAGWVHLCDCGMERKERTIQGQWVVQLVFERLTRLTTGENA